MIKLHDKRQTLIERVEKLRKAKASWDGESQCLVWFFENHSGVIH